MYRDGIAAGEPRARANLALLDERGDAAEAEAVLEEGIAAGETGAWVI